MWYFIIPCLYTLFVYITHRIGKWLFKQYDYFILSIFHLLLLGVVAALWAAIYNLGLEVVLNALLSIGIAISGILLSIGSIIGVPMMWHKLKTWKTSQVFGLPHLNHDFEEIGPNCGNLYHSASCFEPTRVTVQDLIDE